MTNFENLTEKEKEQLCKLLDDRYLMIPKNKIYYAIGGFVSVLCAAFAISWAGTLAGLKGDKAKEATRLIETYRASASNDSSAVSQILKSLDATDVNKRLTQVETKTFAIYHGHGKTVIGEAGKHRLVFQWEDGKIVVQTPDDRSHPLLFEK